MFVRIVHTDTKHGEKNLGEQSLHKNDRTIDNLIEFPAAFYYFFLIQTFFDDVSTTFPIVCDIYTKKDLNG